MHNFDLHMLVEQNACRAQYGLAPLRLRQRNCVACGQAFMSLEQRTCGCVRRRTGTADVGFTEFRPRKGKPAE